MLFTILLSFHSFLRWLVLTSLIATLYRSLSAWSKGKVFSKKDDLFRHWTATITHVQLMLGMVMYFKSPAVSRFRMMGMGNARGITEAVFFGTIHITMMIVAVILVTVGSALAKRYTGDREKFKTIALFFGLALLLILAAIPWPFSPLAQRPLLRNF